MSLHTSSPTLRWAVALALGLSLAACGKKEEAAAPAAPAATQQQAAAESAAAAAAKQQAAALAALTADDLRTRGRQALREQRIYTPAGDNAMEYYIALRKKTEKPDPSAESALMDLQPYAVIAAEQAIGRKDYVEAERLRALISAADPQAPSLARIADAIAKGKASAVQEAAAAETRTAEEAAAAEAARRV
jgi:protein TonB